MATGRHSASTRRPAQRRAPQRKQTEPERRQSAHRQPLGRGRAGARPNASHASGRHSVRVQHVADKKNFARGRSGAGVATKTQYRNRFNLPVVVVIIFIIALVCAISFVVIHSNDGNITGDVREGETITVDIPSGSTTNGIAELLVKDGVIGSSRDFTQRVSELDKGDALQAGTYKFTGGQDIDEIIDAIANGKTSGLTIPEGFTLRQIAQRVAENTQISADDFYNTAHTKAASYVSDYPFLKDAYKGSMEGFLFPATYDLGSNPTVDSLLREMLDKYKEQIAKVDMTYAQGKNLDAYDVVTMAAMVEKESHDDSDKANIASVFYNRLDENMSLGSDVTTYYAVGKDLSEPLTQDDLNSNSPYNTRNPKHRGLPAGPICSPGLKALQAAAKPNNTKYLYFFYSSSQKKTMFYNTLDEFNSAWAKYGS